MKILMVCLGNICRSPMAQGVMEKLIREHNLDWKVDSCGTNGFHDGEQPDPRAMKQCLSKGIDISNQISRRIKIDDFMHSDIILVMDQMNYHTVSKLSPPYAREKIQFLSSFAYPDQNTPVPDPYYDNRFKEAYELIYHSCQAFIEKMK